ncbi:hypothetical protein HY029_00030 [Candidatus Gottesmanbacteria bacterium]|nr:hypothetical protein [Candidatus Gottesmanbacteria bacterium]
MSQSKKPKIFFAIPCGEFFHIQNNIIKTICETLNIECLIIEDHTKTDFLWKKITNGIDDSDYFIADISSKSTNVILELGYALREKKSRFCAIFISNNIQPPVDLQGLKLQKYNSFRDFKEKLINWIKDNVLLDTNILPAFEIDDLPIEDFKDLDRFIRLWSAPGGSFSLTHEGLDVMNAHFPIMTNYLAPLNNYEFEFRARIVNGAVGWAVKGTKRYASIVPEFCLMFNIGLDGKLTPHIFNINKSIKEHGGYKPFNEKVRIVALKKSKEGWFNIKTIVIDDNIRILNDGEIIFEDDFSKEPYKEYYDYPNKQGEIGFRCYQGVEEAIIEYFSIKEI